MFRNWKRAVLVAATGLCLAGGPAAAKSSAVALVCDGEFRLQTARIDGTDETMFSGTMHVALVADLAMSRFCSRNFSRTRTSRTRTRRLHRCRAPGC